MPEPSLARYAWLSVAAAIVTIGLKAGAYFLTGSVGLLSDALESFVNLAAAVVALIVLAIVARPPDEEHQFGHDKAEYFSSGFEGALILFAAASIVYSSVHRLLNPRTIEQVGVGVAISISASLLNLLVARILLRAGRANHSITLEADSRHLMTDVWTSVGVVAGVAAVGLTGLNWLDPVIGLLVGANIIWTGIQLMRVSLLGLLDTALPHEELQKILAILHQHQQQDGIAWHALRTRTASSRRFVSVHLLVPDEWTIRHSHDLAEQIEAEIRATLPRVTLFTHLEPISDPSSLQDTGLDRSQSPVRAS